MHSWRPSVGVPSHPVTESPPLRAAIIGTGRIASLLEADPLRDKPHTHAGWYASHPRTRLVAGCDVDGSRLEAFGQAWGLPASALYADYVEMLGRERPDVVSVCAYARDRAAMCRAALDAGARALWIEKAVACSVDEGEALAAAIAEAGVVAVVDHPRRLEARHRAVAHWIAAETLGALETVHVAFSGHLLHTGTHAWDLLLAWCGRWVRVEASLDLPADTDSEALAGGADGRTEAATYVSARSAALREGVLDRGGRARIVFENGIEAFVTGGAKRYFTFQCDLHFSEGRIRIGNDVFETCVPADSRRYSGFRELQRVDPETLGTMPLPDTTSVLATLIEGLDGGAVPLLSVASAVQALGLGIALVQAGLTGRTVTPATLDRSLRVASV